MSFVFFPIPSNELVFVDGKVDISGSYAGVCTIVATDDIRIQGSVWPVDQNSYLALITEKHIDIESEFAVVQAVMYSHKSDDNGEVHVKKDSVQIVGVAASDENVTDDDLTVSYDSRLNVDIMRELRLPGL